MTILLNNLAELGGSLLWVVLCSLGGIGLTYRAFKLHPNERLLVSFGLGLVLQNWLANLTSQVLPVPLSFWV
ncbi:MAG: hypothetical protein GYA17_11965, partial [Chloroflexi bacterium]|nr:hypothetical protein [Chloroflexota bacterium]